jgi:hypothetical protein
MQRAAGAVLMTACVAGLIAVAGCGSASGQAPSSAASVVSVDPTQAPAPSTAPVAVSAVGRSVAAWQDLTDGDGAGMEVPSPQGALTLDECRWTSAVAFSFDLTWTPAGDSDGPVVLPLQLGFVVGDQASGVAGLATLDQPGPFTVDVTVRSATDGSWRAEREYRTLSVPCGAALVGNDVQGGSSMLVAAPRPAGLGGFDPVSLEGRADGIDLLDLDAPLLPLAWLFTDPEPPAIDRLFVHPTATLLVIEVEYDEPCWSVRTRYGAEMFADDVVEVLQRVGCPPPLVPAPSGTPVVADDVWEVTVSGPPDVVDGFAAELTVLRSERVPAFDAASAGFDADRYFEQQLVELGLTELTQFEWQGGSVLVAIGAAGLPSMQMITAVPGGFNGGGSGLPCRDFSVIERIDDTGRGFVLVAVAGDRVATIDEDGEGPGAPAPVTLVGSAVADIRAGFHELPPNTASFDLGRVVVTEGDGAAVPCVQ